MNNYLILEVNDYIDRFLNKCIKAKIQIYNIEYLNKDKIIIKINAHDYNRLKRLNYYCKVKIVGYEGLNYVKKHVKNNVYIYLLVLFCFFIMDVLTSYIIKIDIIHENSKVKSLVAEELKNNKIKKYSLAKSFEELEKIRKKIINDNNTKLEWISITREGMKYIIRVEERIIITKKEETGYRHIISTKDALVTKLTSVKGDVLVRSGEYVKKGDILISGQIKLYDTVKGNTLATGSVYGEVWYTADISYPLNYEENRYTDNKRTNININNKIILKNKYRYFTQENIRELNILGLKIKIYEECEYQKIKGVLTNEEASNKALKKLNNEFKLKLQEKGTVISQKVLKKVENNSTIDMRVFVVTNEIISDYLYYEIGSEIDDSKISG